LTSNDRASRPLRECGQFCSGGTPSKADASLWRGSLPWFSSKEIKTFDLRDSELHVSERAASSGTTLVPSGTVLFVVRGMSLANEFRVGVTTGPATFNQDVKALIPAPDVHGRYLARCLRWMEPRILGMTESSTHGTKRLPSGAFEGLPIPLPSLPEQRRIADILDKADAIRRKRKQAIALTDQLLRSTFLEMFGDPVTNPKGFSSAILADVAVFRSGDFLPARAMDKDGIYPVYGGNGITGFHGSYMFQEPMVVIGRVGVYCGATHLTKEKSWITDNALYIASMSPSLTKTYLYHALVKANLNQYASQSAQPLISGSRIGQIPMLIPPLPVQGRFEELVRRHDSLSMRQRQSEEYATQLFSALADRSFRGELTRTEPAGRQLSMFNK